MGVTATYCQICGLPVQHDHYVPMDPNDPDGMQSIYRGDGGPSSFTFTADHAWLLEAVGLRCYGNEKDPAVVEGPVHDGTLETSSESYMVWDGRDDYAALHKACWELSGKPDGAQLRWPKRDATLKPYQQQLFEFAALKKDGLEWMLIDPRSNTSEGLRSRERILALLGK